MRSTALPGGMIESGAHTRQRLLDAAESLFSERGFAATSLRDITAKAGCNIAAVSYHFRGKENLYLEMFRRRLGALRESRLASIRSALGEAGGRGSLEYLLRSFTVAFLGPLVESGRGRQLVELMSRELLDPHLPPGVFRTEMILPVQDALVEAIVRVCGGGDRKTVRLCVHSTIAQLVHVIQLQRCLGGEDAAAEFASPRVVDHMVRFSSAGIRASVKAVGAKVVRGKPEKKNLAKSGKRR